MFVIPHHRIEILIPRKPRKHVRGHKRNSRMNPFISEEKFQYLELKPNYVLTPKTLQKSVLLYTKKYILISIFSFSKHKNPAALMITSPFERMMCGHDITVKLGC